MGTSLATDAFQTSPDKMNCQQKWNNATQHKTQCNSCESSGETCQK